MQYGGFASYKTGWFGGTQTVAPPNVRADMFADVVDALLVSDLPDGVAPGTLERVKGAVPLLTGRGYVFSLGDAPNGAPLLVPGPGGKPLTLDFEVWEPLLRQRVPRAYGER